MTKRKKGSIRKYDEWQPEYTPTGRVTKKSHDELESIKAQALLENIKVNSSDLIELSSFIGAVYVAKGGYDFFRLLLGLNNDTAAKAVMDVGTSIVDSFGGFSSWDLWYKGMEEIKKKWPDWEPTKLTIESLTPQETLKSWVEGELGKKAKETEQEKLRIEAQIEHKKLDILTWKNMITDISVMVNGGVLSNGSEVKYENSLLGQKNYYCTPGENYNPDLCKSFTARIEGTELTQKNANAILHGGYWESADGSLTEIPRGKYDELTDLEANLADVVDRINKNILSQSQAEDLARQAEFTNLMLAIGTVGVLRWYLIGRLRTGETITPEV